MTFEEILPAVKAGREARRGIWTGTSRFGSVRLRLIRPVHGDLDLMPQLIVSYDDGVGRPFAGANWDLLADDWELL